jgi:benzoate transport
LSVPRHLQVPLSFGNRRRRSCRNGSRPTAEDKFPLIVVNARAGYVFLPDILHKEFASLHVLIAEELGKCLWVHRHWLNIASTRQEKELVEPQTSSIFPPNARSDLAEEAVSRYGWKALAGAVIGFSMDGFDMLILGFMLAAISADLALTSTQAGSLVTWTMLGAVAGGLVFGPMSDHLGRVKVLTWTILIFAVFTGLCALARGYRDLVFFRAIAGLGLGGEFGIGMALATEAWPASKRARVSSYVMVGWHGGVLLAAFSTPLLLSVIGWRGMFLVGIVPAVVAFVVRRAIDEPDIFVRKHAGKTENSFHALVKDGKTFKTTLGIAILCSVQNFAYYGLMVWLPSYLAKSLGFSLTKSGLWTGVTVLGMACGIWACGQLADRLGRKPGFLLFQVGAVIMVFLYSRITEPGMLLWVGAIMGMFVNGLNGGIGALISESYPTVARATAQNTLWNLGRGIGSLGPVAVGALAMKYSFHAAIGLLASIYFLDIIATLFLIPELKGKVLD